MKWDREKVLSEFISLSNKLNRRPYKSDNPNLYFLSRKYFGSWNNLLSEAGYYFKERQSIKIPPLNSKELYYFLGLLSSDGHIQYLKKGGCYKVMLFTSNEGEKNMLKSLIKDIFNYDASVRIKNYGFSDKPVYEVYVSSKELCDFLNSFGIPSGDKSLILEVPYKIKDSSSDLFWSFVRGVFDGDGSIVFTKVNSTFKIFSGSESFIVGLNNLFLERMFSSAVFKERENLWSLRITKKSEIKKLYSLIYSNSRFSYERKRKRWSEQYI